MACAKDAEPKLTECTVCNNIFTIPKLLRCGHLLCRDCLVTWLQKQPQAGCPLCRCVIADPSKEGAGLRAEEVADGLPTDLAMTAMVEAETLLSSQHMCGVCVDVAAEALCLQCLDPFCAQCSRLHRRQAVSRHHEVEELATLTTERLAAYRPATCPVHKGERASEVYCPDHGVSVCLLCATTVHRLCTVVSLQTKVDEAADELQQLTTQLSEAESGFDASLSELSGKLQGLRTYSQVALAQTNHICDRLKDAVDKGLLGDTDAVQAIVADLSNKAESSRQSLLRKRTIMTTHKAMAKFYDNFQEHHFFMEMATLVKGRAQGLDMDAVLPDSVRQKLVMNFETKVAQSLEEDLHILGRVTVTTKAPGSASAMPGADGQTAESRQHPQQDFTLLQKTQPEKSAPSHQADYAEKKTFGQIKETSLNPAREGRPSLIQATASAMPDLDKSKATKLDQPEKDFLSFFRHANQSNSACQKSFGHRVPIINPWTAHPQLVNTIDGHFLSSNITSLAVRAPPSAEQVFVAECSHSAIKVFSLQSNVLLQILKLEIKPWSMAFVCDHFLVVTSLDQKVIVMADVSNIQQQQKQQLLVCRQFQFLTDKQYLGIAVMPPSQSQTLTLLVSAKLAATNPATVDTISLPAKTVKTLLSSKSVPDLISPEHLHVDPVREVLYVSDRGTCCVLSAKLPHGAPLQVFRYPMMLRPCQVACDFLGHLYVADAVGECVLVRSPKGEWLELLAGDKQNRISPVAVSVTETGLVVACTTAKEGMVMKKYDMSRGGP